MPVSGAISAAKTSEGVTAFKSTVLVSSGEIKADSLIKTDGNSRLREELAAIQIGYIPNPLGETTIDRETLQKKLGTLSMGVDMPERKLPSNATVRSLKALIFRPALLSCASKTRLTSSKLISLECLKIWFCRQCHNLDLNTNSENVL